MSSLLPVFPSAVWRYQWIAYQNKWGMVGFQEDFWFLGGFTWYIWMRLIEGRDIWICSEMEQHRPVC